MVRERTFSTFDKFIIMDDVTLEDITPRTGSLDLLGPRTTALVSELCGLNIEGPAAVGTSRSHVGPRFPAASYIGESRQSLSSATLIVAREHLTAIWNELAARVRAYGGIPAGMEALNSIRLEVRRHTVVRAGLQ